MPNYYGGRRVSPGASFAEKSKGKQPLFHLLAQLHFVIRVSADMVVMLRKHKTHFCKARLPVFHLAFSRNFDPIVR